ncbi:MAG: hypothetical protein AAF366_18645 [Pseudomonadota bacterium]
MTAAATDGTGARGKTVAPTHFTLPFPLLVFLGPAVGFLLALRNGEGLRCGDMWRQRAVACLTCVAVAGLNAGLHTQEAALIDRFGDVRGPLLGNFAILGLMTLSVAGLAWVTNRQFPAYRFQIGAGARPTIPFGRILTWVFGWIAALVIVRAQVSDAESWSALPLYLLRWGWF